MIEVPYWKDINFRNWYSDNVLRLIMNQRGKVKYNKNFPEIIEALKNLSNNDIKNILCCPREELEEKVWIREYLGIADFVGEYNEFREGCVKNKHKSSELKRLRRQYIEKYDGIYLSNIHRSNIDFYSKNWTNFDELRSNAVDVLIRLNEIVSTIFDYAFIDTSFRRNLFEKMDVKVCPYCNQQYINSIADGRYLGDLDHVFPKKIYALFSLSLWNLVPSCKACNQTFKRGHIAHILNPTMRGFDNEAIFDVLHEDIMSIRGESDNFKCTWKILCNDDHELALKIGNNISLFQLNDVYQAHKMKIKDVLKKKYRLDDHYKNDLKKKVGIDSDEQLNYFIYGCSLNPHKFKDELLSKMTYDLVKYG